ncbi:MULTISPECIES: hypothetical protein [unclassified Endozoicomonas]|uniref:hypothetical protein n=1 Tax=unclassified Endozoicomonas TaxID=2644528 RepID=UPI003BB6AAFA
MAKPKSNVWRLARINPAYTSVIGRTKFSGQYGLSVHHGAAVAIARRYFQFQLGLIDFFQNP